MKKTLSIAAITVALSAPAYANLTEEEVQEMLALSNESAAERIVNETSTGDVTAAEIKFALSEMSAAEREAFIRADEQSRMEILRAERLTNSKDSPAETQAITN